MKKEGYFISLGGGKNQVPLIKACNSLGIPVITIDKDSKAPGFHFSNIKIIESVNEYRKIYKTLIGIPLTAPIIGIATRSFGKAVHSCAYLAEKLKLKGITPKSAKLFDNKRKLKEFLEKKGIKVPNSYNWRSKSFLQKTVSIIPYPCILKPASGSGKKGIELFQSKETLRKALENISPDDSSYLLEEYISGDEVTVIGFVENKIFHMISVSDKISTSFPPYIEISHRLPSLFENLSGEIKLICQSIVNSTEIDFAPFVAEFKITPQNEIFLMEAMPEVGGEYIADYLVPEFYGYDYFKNLVRALVGESFENKPTRKLLQAKRSHICLVAPPEGRSKFLDINKFQPGEKETVFLEEQLKQKTTVIDSNTGNASRVYAVGVTNQNSISHADLDKHIREIIAPKFS